jgi:hypothetical protein
LHHLGNEIHSCMVEHCWLLRSSLLVAHTEIFPNGSVSFDKLTLVVWAPNLSTVILLNVPNMQEARGSIVG